MARKKKEEEDHVARNSTPTAEALRSYIERVERLSADAAAIATDIKEVYAEAKGFGLDTKVMRSIIAERKKNLEEVAEFESIRDLYRMVLGMDVTVKDHGDQGADDDTDGVV